MGKRIRLPIFKAFTHPELAKIGQKDGIADAAFLRLTAKNTNHLARLKLHTACLKPGHDPKDGSEESLGWVESAETDGATLFGEIDFTETGERKAGKDLRWFSASFRKDFNMTGEEGGPVLPGPYLDHVAMLGRSRPVVKGLVDLADAHFSGPPGHELPHILFSVADTGEVCYFAEIEPSTEQETDMPTPRETELESSFADEKKKRETLEANFTQLKKDADAVTAKLTAREEADKAAKFSEYQAAKKGEVDAAQKKLALGAGPAAAALKIAAKVYGDPEAEAAFTELIAGLSPIVPGLVHQREGETPSGLVAADFSEAATNPEKGRKVQKALNDLRRTDPKATLEMLQAQVARLHRETA